MSYIRTKEHIYKIIGVNKKVFPKEYIVKENKSGCEVVEDKDIIKRSKYIQDLFDDIVIKKANEQPNIISPQVAGLIQLVNEGYEAYGSIWIGPDLKAQAQLNKNGQWKLLYDKRRIF